MAETKGPSRSHVCSYVKGLKENEKHKTITFRVVRREFVLPAGSLFASTICLAKSHDWNVLVLFDEDGKVHPRVTGVIVKPKWRQRKAASEGYSFGAVLAMR